MISHTFSTTTFLEKTVASIFALFFSQPSQIPALSGGGNTSCKMSSVYSQLTRVIDRQTDGKAISIAKRTT